MAAKAATLTTRVRKTRPRWVRRVKLVFAVGFLLFLIGFTVFGIMFVGEMRHASELLTSLPDKLRQYSTKPTQILSADGQVLYTVQSEFREPVQYGQIPQHIRDAIVAAEDKRFWDHNGVDYWAMGRILAVGAKEGRLSQGGSTLTMQLAKRFYSEGEKTFKRKMQDVALAITMERDMTKEQILTLYLNTMYFGEKAYGIQAAADVYFGKPIDKLSIAESAMLARCVRRPSDENPVKNLQKSIDNRNVVLGIMRDEGKITQSEYDDAIAEKVHLTARKERVTSHLNKAPYFVDHVLKSMDDLMPDVDWKAGGYTIYTTIDTKMQDYADKEVRSFVREHRGDDVNSAAFVLMDKDGKILAEVGGLDYKKSQFNIVTQGALQPGSSFKPFVYSTAFAQGVLSMEDRLENEPFVYPGTEHWRKPYVVHNASPNENTPSDSVESAMAYSHNIPAAHVLSRVPEGPHGVALMAKGVFGINVLPSEEVPSMALGTLLVSPLEMARGYSVFMLHGDRAEPYCITKVVGPDGNVVQTYEPQIQRGVFEPRITSIIDQLLQDVVQFPGATGADAGDVPNARGKTGTTSDHKDIWFCGYTDGLIGVAWCGNNVIRNGKVYQEPMGRHMWGATACAGIWADVMKKAHQRFASSVPMPQTEPQQDYTRDTKPDEGSADHVKVIPPDENTPIDGTTGNDGSKPPVNTPPPTTTGGDGNPPTNDPGTTPPDPTVPDTKPKHDPPRHDPPKRSDNENDTVDVEVCAESGMRATIYCPETVTRTFKRGREPKRRCTIHGG